MKNVIEYITDPAKTDGQLLVSSFRCTPETADIEFDITREMGKRNLRDSGTNLGWHMIQSFKPGEIDDPQKAHELGKQFADAVLKGKYQYVITTHIDKNHCHNHIAFCATSFKDHHKYQSPRKNIYKLCRISNRICRDNGLSESMPTGKKGKSYKEDMEYKKGNSWKSRLKHQVDKAIWTSVNFEEFLLKMEQAGYEVRKGKNLAFRAPRQVNFTNVKTLGSYYTEEIIRERLEKNRHKAAQPKIISAEVRLFIEVGNFVAVDDREGFEDWAELHNLQEAARTFNYLSEHDLLNYEEFQNHLFDVSASITATENRIGEIDQEIAKQYQVQKCCDVYRHCREIVTGEKNAKNKFAYRNKHKSVYALHDSTMKELQSLGITKIPTSEKIQAKIDSLESQKAAVIRDKLNIQKQKKTLDIVQQNMQQLLSGTTIEQAQKQHHSKSPER
jgi:hypothetical protein